MDGFLECMIYLSILIFLVILLLSIMFYDFSFEGTIFKNSIDF